MLGPGCARVGRTHRGAQGFDFPSLRTPLIRSRLQHLVTAYREDLGNKLLPNKRLKLAVPLVLKGSRCVVPWRARTVVHYSCAGWRVARSLSAIR